MRPFLQYTIIPATAICFLLGDKLQVLGLNGLFPELLNKKPLKNTYLNDSKEWAERTGNIDLASIDASADMYASTKTIYCYKEAVELRRNLYRQIENNPKSLPLEWAMMRFYAAAPAFVGGNSGLALQYAGYIASQDEYIGCMAYEYVFTRIKDFASAERWYRKSLMVLPSNNMHWEEITYNNNVQFGVTVTGNFNNWKVQKMYENSVGIYSRKVLIPKCENCVYKLLVDYKDVLNPTKTEILPNDR